MGSLSIVRRIGLLARATALAGALTLAGIAHSDTAAPTYEERQLAEAMVRASQTAIPLHNGDLESLAQRAQALSRLASTCLDAHCPIVKDCSTAAALLQAMVDAEVYLDAMLGALNRASAETAQAHANILAQTRITSKNLEISQRALGVQEYFYRLATMLFDLASLADDLNTMLDRETLLPGDTRWQKLDTLYETLKDTESYLNDSVQIGGDLAGVEGAGATPLTSGTIGQTGMSEGTASTVNDLKSSISDAVNSLGPIVQQYRQGKLGKDPKAIDDLRKGALKVAFRALKAKVEREIDRLKKYIDELIASLSAEEQVLAGLFRERMRASARRAAAEEALSAVRAARGALEDCLARACGMPTVSRPVLPNYYGAPAGAGSQDAVARVGWGQALRDLNARLVPVAEALRDRFDVVDACPPGETFTAPPETPPTDGPGAVPPRHVVENGCPPCAATARELARLLDQIQYLEDELEAIRRRGNLADIPKLEADLRTQRSRLQVNDKYLQGLRDIERNAQTMGLNLAPQVSQDIVTAEAERVRLQGNIRLLERELARLTALQKERRRVERELESLGYRRQELFRELRACQRACAVTVGRVVPRTGNNPFDPLDPTGGGPGTTTPRPTGCTTPQPPAETETVPCPAGQTGSIRQSRSFVCVSGDWVPGPFNVISNTCTGTPAACTTPQPPNDTQTLSCPAGQTGSIIQTRSYSCVNGVWLPGPFATTSNTCTTPPPTGCATNFSVDSFGCSGACGISATALTFPSGSSTLTATPFGSNASATFNCQGATAQSQSSSLTILGLTGHSCTLTASSLRAFTITCRNNSGGTCTSSCSR